MDKKCNFLRCSERTFYSENLQKFKPFLKMRKKTVFIFTLKKKCLRAYNNFFRDYQTILENCVECSILSFRNMLFIILV